MSPESSPAFIIPPAPESPVTPKYELPVAAEIIPPAFVTERAADVQQSSADPAAEAAERIISSVPGYENSQSSSQTPRRGIFEVPTPADPSHVNGWDGQVRR
jgi:hypothetical protein